MNYSVSQQVREKACDCRKESCCLDSTKKSMCEVAEFVSEDLIFIKGSGDPECVYCHSFGSSHFCSCPVRKELFVKYKI